MAIHNRFHIPSQPVKLRDQIRKERFPPMLYIQIGTKTPSSSVDLLI